MSKGNDASALIFILQYFLLKLFTRNLEEEVDWILELGPAKRKSVFNQSSLQLFLANAFTLMTNTTWVWLCWKCSQRSQKPQWGGLSVCTQTSSRAPGKGQNSIVSWGFRWILELWWRTQWRESRNIPEQPNFLLIFKNLDLWLQNLLAAAKIEAKGRQERSKRHFLSVLRTVFLRLSSILCWWQLWY